ncbi:YciI family protein [Actinoplanes sp. NBRC 103695]|uniref:YciI family protein n=1 Tax=Actinoplanes sp. NBRC 103695 TaxID=3032202 RepID=UPI0024A47C8B|nr:YciI family protein [Actinoplanes sp. NBRC 103695]GLZ01435.1 transcription initiation protein [Actinoplanes sp. NBRC 103695]
MAKYMLIMRATDESRARVAETPFDEVLESMGRFSKELVDAGVLLAHEGLEDPSKGVVVDFTAEKPVVTDGPYGETRELFGGFFLIDVPSQEEAVEWAKRIPLMDGSRCEVRRVPTIDEFPQDNEWVVHERAWRERTGQL